MNCIICNFSKQVEKKENIDQMGKEKSTEYICKSTGKLIEDPNEICGRYNTDILSYGNTPILFSS